jgi:hypothetical protein
MLQIATEVASQEFAEKLPVFGSKEFLSAKSKEHGWFVSDKFVLPFVVDNRLRKIGFRRIVLTSEPVSLFPESTSEEEQAFLDEVLRLCAKGKQIGADSISAQANAVFRTVPSSSDSLPWGSYTVDLTKSETAIFDSFDSAHKNRIRKGIRDGVVVRTTSDINTIYQNVKETMVRQNLLFFPSLHYLDELQRRLESRITFYIAEHANRLQGSAVIVHNQHGAFYYYGGSISEPSPGSLTLMQSEIIKDLKKKNIPVYDLMGARLTTGNDAKIEGIQRFKRRFASGMRTGLCFRTILNPVRHRVMIAAVKSFFFLKGAHYSGDVFDQTRRVEVGVAN